MTESRIGFIVLICILTLMNIILLSFSIYEFTKFKTFDPIESQCLVKATAQLSGRLPRLSWTVSYINKLDGNKIKNLFSHIRMSGVSTAEHLLKQYQVIQYLINFYNKVDNL
jgi:hypothetical protein